VEQFDYKVKTGQALSLMTLRDIQVLVTRDVLTLPPPPLIPSMTG
jgi:hypothetical protein